MHVVKKHFLSFLHMHICIQLHYSCCTISGQPLSFWTCYSREITKWMSNAWSLSIKTVKTKYVVRTFPADENLSDVARAETFRETRRANSSFIHVMFSFVFGNPSWFSKSLLEVIVTGDQIKHVVTSSKIMYFSRFELCWKRLGLCKYLTQKLHLQNSDCFFQQR